MNDALHNKVVKWFYDHEELLIAIMNKTPYQSDGWDYEIEVVKEFLTQTEQELVAFYVYKPTLPRGNLGNVSDGNLPWVYDQDPSSGYSARMLVYTTPPQRKPLTREQIVKCQEEASDEWCGVEELFVLYARAIEAAHDIKGEA